MRVRDRAAELGTGVLRFWFGPIPAIRLDAFQRAFSASFLLYMLARLQHRYEWLTDQGFHLSVETESPWMIVPPPLLETWMVPLFALVLLGSTLALIVGWRPRVMIWIVLLCAMYVGSVDRVSAFTLNKLYVVGYAILALAPSARRISGIDPAGPVSLQSAWPLRTLQATLLIQYGLAGLCKTGEWFQSADILLGQIQGLYRTDFAAWLLRTIGDRTWMWSLQMYSSLGFELLAPVIFSVRRLRPLAYIWGVAFHLLIALTMYELVYFSLQIVAFYLMFMDARTLEWLRDWAANFRPRFARG